jgi:hypothetical protein
MSLVWSIIVLNLILSASSLPIVSKVLKRRLLAPQRILRPLCSQFFRLAEQRFDIGPTEAKIVLSVDVSAKKALDMASKPRIDPISLKQWELIMDDTTTSLHKLHTKYDLLTLYESLLSYALVQSLDPLQIATVDVLTTAMVDVLFRLYMQATNDQLMALVDTITDINLKLIETMSKVLSVSDKEG